jgi:tRNA(Ile)-lysidine synthase TilS/MesJ
MEKLAVSVLVDEQRPVIEFRPAELMAKARELGLFSWVLDEDPPDDDRQIRRERSAFGKILARFDGRSFVSRRLEIKGEGHARLVAVYYVDHHAADHAETQPAPV